MNSAFSTVWELTLISTTTMAVENFFSLGVLTFTFFHFTVSLASL